MAKEPFYDQVKLYAKECVFGTLLAIDPSSGGTSVPGYAVFHLGELVASGTLSLGKAGIYVRLQTLASKMREITPVPPDVCVIEQIRGRMAHQYLTWSVGVSISGARTARVVEVPIHVWHALRRSEGSKLKGDESDAIYIGRATIKHAQEVLDARRTS